MNTPRFNLREFYGGNGEMLAHQFARLSRANRERKEFWKEWRNGTRYEEN